MQNGFARRDNVTAQRRGQLIYNSSGSGPVVTPSTQGQAKTLIRHGGSVRTATQNVRMFVRPAITRSFGEYPKLAKEVS